MVDLVLIPSEIGKKQGKPYSLCLRYHDLGGTSYPLLTYVTGETAREIIRAGEPYWLYGEPR